MNLKESTLNKSDVKTALNNALKNGEEFDIPFKYSDKWEFTDELDNYLDKQGYEFVGSFRDKKYGSLYEYSDGFESIYLMMDTSLSSRAIVTGIISDKVYNESKKSTKKSLTEKMLQDICNAWVIGKVKGEFKGRDYCHEGNDYSLYNIGNIIEDALRDNYIVEFDGDDKTKTVIFNLINKDGKNVGTLEIFPDERYSAENYEDGFNWEDLNMKEIIKDFEDTLGYRIEYLKNDKRFDYSDRFWYKESKKFARKSMKESKVDYQSVINSIIPKEYANNKNAYKYALSCVTSLYNEDEYDSDDAKVYFLNCYLSDSFPWWVDELGEEEMDALANGLYDGLMKWKDIDSSWFEE